MPKHFDNKKWNINTNDHQFKQLFFKRSLQFIELKLIKNKVN